eukprot:1232435-Alexandrium_andersonii.AAC.1
MSMNWAWEVGQALATQPPRARGALGLLGPLLLPLGHRCVVFGLCGGGGPLDVPDDGRRDVDGGSHQPAAILLL